MKRTDLFGDRQPGFKVRDIVRERLPLEWWETWEMADQEINRIISDELGDHYEIDRHCWVSRRFLTRPTKRTEILFKDKVRRILRQCRK